MLWNQSIIICNIIHLQKCFCTRPSRKACKFSTVIRTIRFFVVLKLTDGIIMICAASNKN